MYLFCDCFYVLDHPRTSGDLLQLLSVRSLRRSLTIKHFELFLIKYMVNAYQMRYDALLWENVNVKLPIFNRSKSLKCNHFINKFTFQNYLVNQHICYNILFVIRKKLIIADILIKNRDKTYVFKGRRKSRWCNNN